MVYVRSRKFCCCLPVRFGVFVLALFGALGGGFICVGGWKQIVHLAHNPITERDKIALWIQTVMYTLLAFLSILGLIGTFTKSRGLIALYSTMLFSHLGFSIATGAFYLYTLFHQEGDTDVDKCIDGSTDDTKIEACEKGFKTLRGIVVGLFILVWLIELYGCIIVSNYADQLDEEESLKYRETASAPTASFITGSRVTPTQNYPFNAPSNSYGVQANSNNV